MSTKGEWGPHFDVAGGTSDEKYQKMEGYKPTRQAWADDGIGWVKRLLKEGESSLKDRECNEVT